MHHLLLLGASGYVGQFIVEHFLLQDGWALFAGCHETAVTWPAGVTPIRVDITDAASISAAIQACTPHVIVNCAAMAALGACEAAPASAEAINCPHALLAALRGAATTPHLIHFSTDIVFPGRAPGVPAYTEASEVLPAAALNVYGRTKATFEVCLLDVRTTTPFTILRCSNVLGPAPPYHRSKATVKFVQWLVTEMAAGKTLTAFADELRSYVSVFDVVAIVARVCAAVLAREPGIPRLLNVGGPHVLTRVDVATAAAAGFGAAVTIVPCKRADAGLAYAAPADAGMDTAAAAALLARPLQDVRDAVRVVFVPALLSGMKPM